MLPDWHKYEASEDEAVIIHLEPDAKKEVCRDGIARRVKAADIILMGFLK